MPDMNGAELAQAIQADPNLASMPLVLLCPVGQQGSGHQHEGVAAYLTKPVRQAQLYTCLEMVMTEIPQFSAAILDAPGSLGDKQEQIQARVLLAEDNAVNQKVAVQLLKKMGCRVDTVANGREAVEALAHVAYDLVLMDCQMPEMDGFMATARIREQEAASGGHITIIAMTANAMTGDREHCIAAGMDDYVSKPVQYAQLFEVLKKWAS